MKKIYFLLLLGYLFPSVSAQTYSKDKMVPLTATYDASAPSITLHWLEQENTTSYDIYRKTKESDTWTDNLATGLSATTTSFVDTNIEKGKEYEYIIRRNFSVSPNLGYGFILCAIERPAIYNQGILLLVVDTLTCDSLQFEIQRWIEDAESDGWVVKTIGVNPSDKVEDVKSYIVTRYWEDADNTQALFLLGRVPVPYSGNICPDGHPDHYGAWPSDGYYADLDGSWTDVSVNNTASGKERTNNIPADGKFDQSTFPTSVDLQMGRVDMRNLPLYAKSEITLLKQYLDKNHAYKNKHFTTLNRGLVRDNFTSYSEGFAASAFNSFYTICDTQVYNIGYNTVLAANDYQWAYGCGGGSYTSCSGVITSAFLASDTLQNIFNFLFGSYFGDWDNTSSLLRSALASGSLSIAWSGRPYWHVHQMALGYPIGYCAKRSMNNANTYLPGAMPQGVHMALLGDPTLRAHTIAPPSNVTASFKLKECVVSWSPSPDTVAGYYIFKRLSKDNPYFLISPDIISDTVFSDQSSSDSGTYQYLVRAVKLQITPSGSYYNLSLGKNDTAYNHQAFVAIAERNQTQNVNLYPNPSSDQLTFDNGEQIIQEIKIYDVIGKEIKHILVNDTKITLNISELHKGVYLCEIKTAKTTVSKKFIKE